MIFGSRKIFSVNLGIVFSIITVGGVRTLFTNNVTKFLKATLFVKSAGQLFPINQSKMSLFFNMLINLVSWVVFGI